MPTPLRLPRAHYHPAPYHRITAYLRAALTISMPANIVNITPLRALGGVYIDTAMLAVHFTLLKINQNPEWNVEPTLQQAR